MKHLTAILKIIWNKFLIWGRQDPPRAAVIISICITLFIIIVSYARNHFSKRSNYKLDTLKKNGFANDHTQIKKSWFNGFYIFKPNKMSSHFLDNLGLFSELFNDDRIIGVRFRKESVFFERAKFDQKTFFGVHQSNFLFTNQDGKQFEPEDHTILLMVRSGGGKTSFLRAYVFGFLEKYKNGQVVISDPHGSFFSLAGIPGINVYDSGSMEGKRQLLEKIKEGREYQKSIFLGSYETLEEAWRAEDSILKEKKPWLFLVDEMLESFSTASSKDDAYQVNQEIIKNLQHLVTSARKYQQYVLAASQANLVSQLQIHQNLFTGVIYGHTNEDTTSLKGLPLNLPILKRLGVFYYTSKTSGARFIMVQFVSKIQLVEKAKQVKNDPAT